MVVKVYVSGLDDCNNYTAKYVDIYIDVSYRKHVDFGNVLPKLLLKSGFSEIHSFNVEEITLCYVEV